jgi:cation-transporting ATPase 13A2
MVGYKRYTAIWLLMALVYLASGGLLWLVGYWKPDWLLKATCYIVPLPMAQYVFLTRESGGVDVETVIEEQLEGDSDLSSLASYSSDSDRVALVGKSTPVSSSAITYFIHRNIRYIYSDKVNLFRRAVAFDNRTTLQKLHSVSKQLPVSGTHRQRQEVLYGLNHIDVPIKPIHRIFIEEVLDPFYIFQLFAVILWFYEFYIYYAICIVLISGVSIFINLRETRRNLTNLHNMVKFSGSVRFCHQGLNSEDNQIQVVDSKQLLPGDIVDIPSEGMVLSFDAVLMAGGLVVNESMLTGWPFDFFISAW